MMMSAFLLGDHIGNKTYMQKRYKGYDRLNGEKFIKLLMDICLLSFIQIQIGKIFLTLLKIKIQKRKNLYITICKITKL